MIINRSQTFWFLSSFWQNQLSSNRFICLFKPVNSLIIGTNIGKVIFHSLCLKPQSPRQPHNCLIDVVFWVYFSLSPNSSEKYFEHKPNYSANLKICNCLKGVFFLSCSKQICCLQINAELHKRINEPVLGCESLRQQSEPLNESGWIHAFKRPKSHPLHPNVSPSRAMDQTTVWVKYWF